jgi:hypothetical protein
MTDDMDDDNVSPVAGRIRRIASVDPATINIGDLPTDEQMMEYERIFWSRCQLDHSGRRTRTPREKPASGFVRGQNSMWYSQRKLREMKRAKKQS